MSSFDFQVENSGRRVLYKLYAQSLRLFGLHRDVNDAHRAGANRLLNKQTLHPKAVYDLKQLMSKAVETRATLTGEHTDTLPCGLEDGGVDEALPPRSAEHGVPEC